MRPTVAGLFYLRLNAENALRELERAGFSRGEISLVGAGDPGDETQVAQRLIELQAPEDPAREYSHMPGTAVLVVQTTDPESARRALAVLKGTTALNSLLRAVTGSNGELEESGIQAAHLRPSAALPVPDPCIFDADDPAESGIAVTEYESEWRRSFEVSFRDSGYRYEQLWPAYRYGAEVAVSPRFAEHAWKDVERTVQHDWEQRNPNTWEQAHKAIRYAWHSVRARGRRAEAG